MPESTRTRRFEVLDAGRGVAAFAVLVFHAIEVSAPAVSKACEQFLQLGYGGVVLFFLISGYVINMSLGRAESLKAFAINRGFRLYPLFLFSMVAALLFIHFGISEWNEKISPLKAAVFNLTMLQEWIGKPSLMGLYWTLGYEMIFYIIMAVLFSLKKSDKAHNLLFPILGALCLLLGLSISKGSWVGGGKIQDFSYLFLGVALSSLHRGIISLKTFHWFLVGTATVNMAMYGIALPLSGRPDLAQGRLLTATLVLIVTYIASFNVHRTVSGLLVYLGKISFSLYLMHGLVLRVLKYFPALKDIPLVFVIVAAVLSIAIAAATYQWIELPGVALGKRLVKKRNQIASTAA